MKRHAHTPERYSTKEVTVSDLTTVELLWLEKRIENRVRFGRAVSESILDRNRRILSFAPGSIFAFVRWTSNDFGTVLSRIDILRAMTPGQPYSTVPWITPGGESLLRLSGWPKRMLKNNLVTFLGASFSELWCSSIPHESHEE